MTNLKDVLTTIFGILGGIAVVVLSLPQSGIPISSNIEFIAGLISAISIAVIGYLNGKNHDGTSKAPSQLLKQKEAKEIEKEL